MENRMTAFSLEKKDAELMETDTAQIRGINQHLPNTLAAAS
ncbi:MULTISPECIES: hypothetical protein [unclassified Microcoleus]